MKHFLSRKFLLSLAALGILTWLRLEHEITPEVFADCLKVLLGGYTLGNVAQKAFIKKEPE